MRYLIVSAHPEPQSFNHSLVRAATTFLEAQGHEVKHSDLYAMQWQPVSDRRNFSSVHNPDYYKQQLEELHATEHDTFSADIATEMDKLFWYDTLILQFPLWWFGMPAIMKGWVDKVFAMGKIYSSAKWFETGSFVGKKAMVSITTGGPQRNYSEGGRHPSVEKLLLPIHHGILEFNGFTVADPFVSWEVAHIADSEREQYIKQFQQRLVNL